MGAAPLRQRPCPSSGGTVGLIVQERRFIVPRARIVVKIDHEMNSKTKDFAEDADRIKELIEEADLKGRPKVVSLEITQEFDSEK
jgi:hypothetical protein